VSQLGDAYELHLVGLLASQPDSCLSWKSQGISSALTVCFLLSLCLDVACRATLKTGLQRANVA
jgi:hypothetical protein